MIVALQAKLTPPLTVIPTLSNTPSVPFATPAPTLMYSAASDPSPCLPVIECEKTREGHGIDKEKQKTSGMFSDKFDALWAKVKSIQRGLSDPGIQHKSNPDMGAAPGNGGNSERVPVSHFQKEIISEE